MKSVPQSYQRMETGPLGAKNLLKVEMKELASMDSLASDYQSPVFGVGCTSTSLLRMLNPTFVKRGATSILTAGRSAMHCFITGPFDFLHVTHLLNSCATVLCPPINQHPAWWMATWIIWWPWCWTCCGSDVLSDRQHGFSLASEQGALLQTLKTAADSTRRPNSITSNSLEQSQVCCSL